MLMVVILMMWAPLFALCSRFERRYRWILVGHHPHVVAGEQLLGRQVLVSRAKRTTGDRLGEIGESELGGGLGFGLLRTIPTSRRENHPGSRHDIKTQKAAAVLLLRVRKRRRSRTTISSSSCGGERSPSTTSCGVLGGTGHHTTGSGANHAGVGSLEQFNHQIIVRYSSERARFTVLMWSDNTMTHHANSIDDNSKRSYSIFRFSSSGSRSTKANFKESESGTLQ